MLTDSDEIDMIEKVKAIESIATTMDNFSILISELESHIKNLSTDKPHSDYKLLDKHIVD